MVDTCAAEFESATPYYYSTYEQENESVRTDNKKVIVLGSGPIRIGQGVEFDYATVHCVKTVSYTHLTQHGTPGICSGAGLCAKSGES